MKKNIGFSIGYVTVIMIFSRLMSLVGTQVYMAHFGASGDYINIYSYAIQIPNTIFNCIGTALATIVIPIYGGYVAKGEEKKAHDFANNIITITIMLSVVLVAVGMAVSPVIVKLTSFSSTEQTYSFAVKALMIMMPVMIFYGQNYIFQGILQSHGKYSWPAFVSVPSSLIVIFYVFLLSDKFGVYGLLIATAAGICMQALILIPPVFKTGYRYRFSLNLKDEDIRHAGRLALTVFIGVSAYQLNMFYNVTMIARFKGMVTLLTYVQNIVIYMVLAFIYSVTAVVYPKLSAKAAVDDMEGYRTVLNNVLNMAILLLVPITFGCISVRTQFLDLIAKWGKITQDDAEKAALLMALYSIGIIGIGLKEILDRAFYAIKITKISALNGFVIMLINIAASLVLIRFMGAYGIPLAYSVSSLCGMIFLLVMLRKKAGNYLENTLSVFIKSIVASGVMSFAIYFINEVFDAKISSDTLIARTVKLAVPAFAGIVVYGIMTVILKVPEVRKITDKIFKKVKN